MHAFDVIRSAGSASLPFFGVETAILDENGKELSGECSGRLVLKRPVPSMMRTVHGDHQRFEDRFLTTAVLESAEFQPIQLDFIF